MAMASMGAVSTDLYLPSAPAIREAFATTTDRVQLTLSAYFLGTALSHFFFGLFSDRFGRRVLTLIGLATYFGASLGILAAPNIEVVIGLRFVQGAGAAVGGVLGVLIIRDVFQEQAAARWLGHRASAVTISFVLAPLVGGWLEITFGWIASFRLMAIFGGGLLVIAWFVLAETHRDVDPDALRFGRAASNIKNLLSDRQFLGYLLVPPLMFGGFFAFLASAPFLYIQRLGLSPGLLGAVFLLHSVGFLIGIQAARPLNRRYGLDRVIFFGTLIGLVAAVAMLALALAGQFSIIAVTGPVVLVMFGLGFVNPNATIRGVNLHPKVAGLASAIMGTALLGFASFFTWLIGLFPDDDAVPLSIIVFGATVMAFAVAARTVRAA